MYNALFQKAILPGLDWLNGTRVWEILRTLERTEHWPVDRLLELQRAKLARLWSWTRQTSDFYREHWRRAPEERRAKSIYPELDAVPLVTKADLRSAVGQFPLKAYRGRVRAVQTSGSTGAPMTFFRTMEQESWFWALRFRMWRWAGYQPGDRYLAINLNSRHAWKKRLQDVFFRCTYATYTVANQDSERIVSLLRSRRITHVNGFSSSIAALARYMEERGLGNPGTVRGISATGDNLFPARRELIERVFGVGVTDYYGAGGEGLHLASQCERRQEYHLHLENAIVEIITDGRPARPGEVGRVVVTQLDNDAMPLIRYDVGDLAVATHARSCDCGRPGPLVHSVEGRACDVVRVPDGSVLLPQFFFIGPFKTVDIRHYQVVQDQSDHLTIKLVGKSERHRRACEDALRAHLMAATRGLMTLDFQWLEQVPLSGRGKPRPVISPWADGQGDVAAHPIGTVH